MVKYPPLAANVAKTVAETRVKNQLIRLRMLGEEAFGVTLPQVKIANNHFGAKYLGHSI